MNKNTILELLKLINERVDELKTSRSAIQSASLLVRSVYVAICNEIDRLQKLGAELETMLSKFPVDP